MGRVRQLDDDERRPHPVGATPRLLGQARFGKRSPDERYSGSPPAVVIPHVAALMPGTEGLPHALRRPAPQAGPRTRSSAEASSLRLDVGGPDHLVPFLGLFGDELAEVGRRAWKCGGAPLGKPRLQLRVGEGRVDLRVELVDDLGWCVLWRDDPKHLPRIPAGKCTWTVGAAESQRTTSRSRA